MKLYVVVLLFTLGVACARLIQDDGQPGCKSGDELQAKGFRNIWDPTAYWKCETLGVAAKRVRCPDNTAWIESQKQCVEWDSWVWETPIDPPSKP